MTDHIPIACVGIDPGLAGGIAAQCSVATEQGLLYKMPETEKDLWDIFQQIKLAGWTTAVLEKVSSSPQMGVTSAFTFGRGLGRLEMGLIAAGFRVERVSPVVWQKAMGCLSKGDKNVTKRRAQELFPRTKITHWNADALLLAEWGRRTLV